MHNPCSQEISVRHFLRSNARAAGGSTSVQVFHSDAGVPGFTASVNLKDVTGVTEFKSGFFNLFVCTWSAKPWDRSLLPLWAYYEEKKYFESRVTPHNYYRMVDPGVLCSAFCDHILHTNASRFQNKQCHLTKVVSNILDLSLIRNFIFFIELYKYRFNMKLQKMHISTLLLKNFRCNI